MDNNSFIEETKRLNEQSRQNKGKPGYAQNNMTNNVNSGMTNITNSASQYSMGEASRLSEQSKYNNESQAYAQSYMSNSADSSFTNSMGESPIEEAKRLNEKSRQNKGMQ